MGGGKAALLSFGGWGGGIPQGGRILKIRLPPQEGGGWRFPDLIKHQVCIFCLLSLIFPPPGAYTQPPTRDSRNGARQRRRWRRRRRCAEGRWRVTARTMMKKGSNCAERWRSCSCNGIAPLLNVWPTPPRRRNPFNLFIKRQQTPLIHEEIPQLPTTPLS